MLVFRKLLKYALYEWSSADFNILIDDKFFQIYIWDAKSFVSVFNKDLTCSKQKYLSQTDTYAIS